MEEIMYEPLLKSVNILCIDDEPWQLDFFNDIFGRHQLFNPFVAKTAKEAESILRSQTIHLVTLDCGIDDIENNEFYLLEKYSSKIPFVIISGSADMERAFDASKSGAVGVISKPPEIDSAKFWDSFSDAFLDYCILPANKCNSVIQGCCDILKQYLPDSVSDWASQAKITDGYLRRVWNDCFTIAPKHLLFLYRFYRFAFTYYNTLFLSSVSDTIEAPSAPDSNEHRNLVSYYLLNRKELDPIRDE
jgi:CheY-like chemotaxis protein